MINVQRWEHSRDSDRHSLDAPEHLAEELDVRQHGIVAVIGSSPERYALPLVPRVGTNGIIYSLDASDPSIVRPALDLPSQIRVRHSSRDLLPLPDHSVDLALLAFVLRQIAHLRTMLTEIRRVLRPGGRIAVADWIRQEEREGPTREERVSAATCERWLAAIGFGLLGQRALNRSQYLIIGRRPMTD
ncbi:MAG: methyltransferase domain-containing protein [Gemmatimonadaceae bacterium]